MPRTLPTWPILMTPRTAASYLDCAEESGNLKRTFKEWRDLAGFPAPDKKTGMFYRPAIDSFLEKHFGYADPWASEKSAMDKEFQGS